MKRKACIAIVLGLSLLLIGSSALAAKTTITFWHHSNVAWVEAWSKLVADFEKEYPNIEVQVEVLPDFGDKVMSAYAAGTEPDVVDILGSMLLRYAQEGLLAEIPEYLMTPAQMNEAFWPVTLASYAWEGKYYGIPFDFNVAGTGALFNLDLVEMAGLEIPQSWIESRRCGETWTELAEFCKKLTMTDHAGNIMQAGLGMVNCHEHSDFFAMIFQQGGDYRDFENTRVNFETPEARNALQFFLDALDRDKLHAVTLPSRHQMFMEQTAAATIGGPWYKPVIDKEVEGLRYVRLNLPPFFGTEPKFPVKGGWGLAVSRRSKNPEAAWKFVEFAMRPENMKPWNFTTGTVPTLKAFATDPDFDYEETLDVAHHGVDMGAHLVIDVDQFIWLIVTPEMRAVFHGEKTIDDALKTMTDMSNDMINKLHKK
ncbi:MAG: ABC transporter substrate-binding protein [Firmicutes bacterium]|mgnify:CR=1 FL=1|nr:ABC transporter substrate-binding protein [Bacillota bacterium]